MPNRITTWQPKHQQHVSNTIIFSISEECEESEELLLLLLLLLSSSLLNSHFHFSRVVV